MLDFDSKGKNSVYEAQGREESVFDNQRINWGRWPFADDTPPNIWVCPRCGYYEDVGQDVIAQRENRPRLF